MEVVGKQSRLRQEKRRQGQKPAPVPANVVKSVDERELKALIDRARSGALSEKECGELLAVVETLAFVTRELDTKNLTLKRLRAMFGLATSEKLDQVLPPGGPPPGAGETPPDGGDSGQGGRERDPQLAAPVPRRPLGGAGPRVGAGAGEARGPRAPARRSSCRRS